jgi:hypothetical protein
MLPCCSIFWTADIRSLVCDDTIRGLQKREEVWVVIVCVCFIICTEVPSVKEEHIVNCTQPYSKVIPLNNTADGIRQLVTNLWLSGQNYVRFVTVNVDVWGALAVLIQCNSYYLVRVDSKQTCGHRCLTGSFTDTTRCNRGSGIGRLECVTNGETDLSCEYQTAEERFLRVPFPDVRYNKLVLALEIT